MTNNPAFVNVGLTFKMDTRLRGYDKVGVYGLSYSTPLGSWSKDKENRLNPSNRLCLNALHDKAFDKGLVAFSNNYEMLLSERIEKSEPEKVEFFLKYNKQKINLPKRFLPDKDFLAYHRNNVFKAV